MIPMAIILEEDYIGELRKRLKELHDLGDIEVGYFSDSGRHESSGWNYPTLMSYLSSGNEAKNLPPRPVLQLAYAFHPLSSSPLSKDLHRYLSNIASKKPPVSSRYVARSYAQFYVDNIKVLFGNSNILAPNAPSTVAQKGKQAPLVWTSSLRNATTYKIGGKGI